MTERLPNWVDCRLFIEWLEEVRPEFRSTLAIQGASTFHLSTSDEFASLGKVDRICVALDLHICEIPDDVWTDRSPNRRYSIELEDDALRMIEDGASLRETAKALGISKSTVARWVRMSGS